MEQHSFGVFSFSVERKETCPQAQMFNNKVEAQRAENHSLKTQKKPLIERYLLMYSVINEF